MYSWICIKFQDRKGTETAKSIHFVGKLELNYHMIIHVGS